MVFKWEWEKEKQSSSDPEKIVLEYQIKHKKFNFIEKFQDTHQNVLKQVNKKVGGG